MHNAGEPKIAKNTGGDNSKLNVYKFINDNPPPKVVTVHGDPL